MCHPYLAALAALQALNRIHRDISPNNIYQNEVGEGMLSDLEFVRTLGSLGPHESHSVSATVCTRFFTRHAAILMLDIAEGYSILHTGRNRGGDAIMDSRRRGKAGLPTRPSSSP